MALVDEMTIAATAGRGGDGVVRWLHLKGKEFSGPAGGNGGDGGSVYLRGVRDVHLLARYRGAKRFEASVGEHGGSFNKAGASGENLFIDVPVGALVTNRATGERFELLQEGQQIMVLRGGRGGVGNAAFKSSVNRTPTRATKGQAGEDGTFYIELRLIADAGFVGLPNAGKSTLLNALTGASAKVGAYPFTTLDPNLGMLHGYVLADIPGLIEGASDGRGLGSKFLRHVSRTALLVHCVSLESGHPLEDYDIVRKELEAWETSLSRKPEMVVLTKSDTRTPEDIQETSRLFEGRGIAVEVVSAIDDGALKRLSDALVEALRKIEPSATISS